MLHVLPRSVLRLGVLLWLRYKWRMNERWTIPLFRVAFVLASLLLLFSAFFVSCRESKIGDIGSPSGPTNPRTPSKSERVSVAEHGDEDQSTRRLRNQITELKRRNAQLMELMLKEDRAPTHQPEFRLMEEWEPSVVLRDYDAQPWPTRLQPD